MKNTDYRTLKSLSGLETVANKAIENTLASLSDEDLLNSSRHLQYMSGGRSWQIMLAFAMEVRKRYAKQVGWTDSPKNDAVENV